MRSLQEIVEIVEAKAIEQYGSINKMLTLNNINKSIVGNMKREKPSIPNIIEFCKLADAIHVTVGYLLKGEENSSCIVDAKEIIGDKLATDERAIITTYRELDDDGKDLVQHNIKEIWADHRQPKGKSSTSSNDELIG